MLPSRNIFLVGMMGAGKSTVGKLLARRLGKTFLDSDHEIRRRTGVEIPVIFEIEGEEGFRAREAAILRELTQQEDVVLATGGGAVLRPENRALLKARGTVIYLRGSVEELWARTRHDRNRPLLQTADPKARLGELLQERDPLYREVADLVVDTSRASAPALARRIEKRLQEFERTKTKDALELDTDA
ncbi:shikimate kinase AroK [Pelomicrobium sp.]|jgi:shikimate kinase|uniref:shikimate kinase AroK n=1 Tax=Pelomicrobium sp. TaxID=2815319 RepID=UPI002FDE7859